MRPREETMAALMNLKFQGVVIQTLISEYDRVGNFYSILFIYLDSAYSYAKAYKISLFFCFLYLFFYLFLCLLID